VACAKKAESSDSDSSDESINVMELGQRIPHKKQYAQRTIRFDARGNQVDIEDSDSDDDCKMPPKISHKRPKKVADPMDTESSEETDEDEDFKASKEEKAFLKSIDRKENSGTDSDWLVTVEQNGSETKYINGNNIICDNIECFASTAEILRPKKRIKVEDLSTVNIGYIKDNTQTDSMKT
jgi:hypothetical protein